MRIAILSDIHSNLQALSAVLQDMKNRGIDKIYSLGDVIGYGANPVECLDLLMSHPKCGITTRGNHEEMAINYLQKGGSVFCSANFSVSSSASAGILYCSRIVSAQHIKTLTTWPNIIIKADGLGITLVHGSIACDHLNDYVNNFEWAEYELSCSETRISFLGHTHRPFFLSSDVHGFHRSQASPRTLHRGRRYLINVGSVGQPRDHIVKSAYGILQIGDGIESYQQRRVDYDISAAAKAIRKAKLPEWLAERLMKGE